VEKRYFPTLETHPLLTLAKPLPSCCPKTKADNTSKKYRYTFDRFTKWCMTFELHV
jgi:hypothetical protein